MSDLDAGSPREHFEKGEYPEAVETARERLAENSRDAELYETIIDSLSAMGRLQEAAQVVGEGLSAGVSPARMRVALYEVALRVELPEVANQVLRPLVSWSQPTTDDPDERVAYGLAQLHLGLDPKQVLDDYFRPALEESKKTRSAYVAIAELALDKEDEKLAARTLRDGLKQFPDDPWMQFLMARAIGPVAPEAAEDWLRRATARNPRHPEILLFQAENAIDRRDFEAAKEPLAALEELDPQRPELWALRAVIAGLTGKPDEAESHRSRALIFWPRNPGVDQLIGRKLTQQYRFEEGIKHLEMARARDFRDPTIQLDLGMAKLRYGLESEGWELIERVREADPYNLTAYNLMELRDRIESFVVLREEGIELRMDPDEAAIYGGRALQLLVEAQRELEAKYGVRVPYPIMVEIFAEQSDFAVRTFAMPGGEGFLGVCFGPLITAASPGAHLGRANWEAVLWHELCHTITLVATRHRIPRWLTEGLSVYEERQREPRWGNKLTPGIARKILTEELPPVEELDALFRSGDMGTAYYYASWIVEGLIEEHGFDKMRELLARLRMDEPVPDALAAVYGDLERLNAQCRIYVKEQVEREGGRWDWTVPEPEAFAEFDRDPEAWVEANPENLWGRLNLGRKLAGEENWGALETILRPVIDSGFYIGEQGNPHALLAEAYRRQERDDAEREILLKVVERDAEALWARLRLAEIGLEDPATQRQLADEILAIEPRSLVAWRLAASAAEETGETASATSALESLLLLEPPEKSRIHLQLANLKRQADDGEAARRHLLQAIELSPRNREAYRRLKEWQP